MRRIVLAHGGTASKEKDKDGTDAAAKAGMKALDREGPMGAAVAAVVALEDDERFNAGTGSNYRFDGETIEMDAAVMDSRNRYGGVACVERVKNPVLVARELLDCPNNLLCGPAAVAYARTLGFEEYDPGTERAREKWRKLVDTIRKGEDDKSDNEWDLDALRKRWNFERPFSDVFGDAQPKRKASAGALHFGADTVGAVATDGKIFAAAASTGGTIATLRGRIGDTPTIGAGLYAGEFGAIAASGNGDYLLRERLATKLHQWMGEGMSPQAVVKRMSATAGEHVDTWAVVVGLESWAAGGNRDVAWSVEEG